MSDDERPKPTPIPRSADPIRRGVPSLSRADAIAAIVARTPLSAADIEGFLACSDAERAELIAAYRDSEKMPSLSAWDVFLAGLKLCAELAGYVLPIQGVLSAVFGKS